MEEQSNRKSSKSRRETSVQGTNDSSIVSKCSTSTCGYFKDDFLQHFVAKQSRRAPLIHRGYYIRAVAFDNVFRKFLEDNAGNKTQMISLGCGFDSTYFRLKDANILQNTTFYEVDFPELVKRKRKIIESKEELLNFVSQTTEPPMSPYIELSCQDYYLLGVDLTRLNTLEAALKMCAIDFQVPTLLFSECVMTYMTRRCSTDVVKWAAETFENSVFVMYEQMNPDDAFGLFMQRHFHSIGSPLKCINAFPTLKAQKKRFLDNGWCNCEVVDMNTFYYDCLPMSERIRVENIEAFDEYEELNLKYSHYFMLVASTIRPEIDYLIPILNIPDCLSASVPVVVNIESIVNKNTSICRFGHCSSLVHGGFVITTGGFGEVDGRHQRLTDITVTETNTFQSQHVHCISPQIQYARMHHTSVSLSDGSVYLMAGRQSPYFLCQQMIKIVFYPNNETNQVSQTDVNSSHLKVTAASQSVDVTDQDLDQKSNTVTSDVCNIQICDYSKSCNGFNDNSSIKNTASNSSQNSCNEKNDEGNDQSKHDLPTQSYECDFGKLEISVVNQSGDVPVNRWRHAACAVTLGGVEHIFLHGGKIKTGDFVCDSFIFNCKSQEWKKFHCTGDVPGPRHSHNALYWKGHVVMTGGMDHQQVPLKDVYQLDLQTRVWTKLDITGHLHARYSHTGQILEDKLILIGGIHLSHPAPGVAVIDLVNRTAVEYDLPTADKSNLLMLHRVVSIKTNSDHILVLGGGGNCFSFGTHLNDTPLVVNVKDIL